MLVTGMPTWKRRKRIKHVKQVHIKGDIDLYSKNSLSILITQDGLSYSIFDINDNKVQALSSRKFSTTINRYKEIEDFLAEEKVLDIQFDSIKVVYASKNVTIVPAVIFDEENAHGIYALNYKPNNDCQICYTKLPKSEIVVVFAIENELKATLDKLFAKYSLYPQSYPFIETYLTKTKISEKPNRQRMLVQVFENFFEILVIDKGQIINYNTYNYTSSNDILYFIINTFEQLELSQEDCEVDISGFIEPDNLAAIYLKKFVRTVYFESINKDFKHFYKFQEFAPHYFYNFLNINL